MEHFFIVTKTTRTLLENMTTHNKSYEVMTLLPLFFRFLIYPSVSFVCVYVCMNVCIKFIWMDGMDGWMCVCVVGWLLIVVCTQLLFHGTIQMAIFDKQFPMHQKSLLQRLPREKSQLVVAPLL